MHRSMAHFAFTLADFRDGTFRERAGVSEEGKVLLYSACHRYTTWSGPQSDRKSISLTSVLDFQLG